MNRLVKEGALLVLEASGYLERRLSRSAGAARILTYHGLCRDKHRGAWWFPDSFVTATQFDGQMHYVARHMNCVPLETLVTAIVQGNPIRPRTVAITFDDGYANNVALAAPLLARYGLRATFFLTTGLIGTGELLWTDRLRMIQRRFPSEELTENEILSGAADPKRVDVETVLAALSPWWLRMRHGIPAEAYEGLRLMTWDDAKTLQAAGHSMGAHTRRHAVLTGQPEKTRGDEITGSLDDLRERLGVRAAPFAYPNGQPSDFGEYDVACLRRLGVLCAVTTVAGPNGIGEDVLLLRRNPVGLYHSQAAFLAELAGLRDQAAARGRSASLPE